MSISQVPALKKGWLKKQSRTGLVTNWKTRFFVLSAGRVYYYEKEIDCFPYGDVLKVLLFNANSIAGILPCVIG
jgi:hypothetical protein